MKEVLAKNGPVSPALEYLAKPKGQWLAVPGIRGTLLLTCNSRIDLLKQHAGIDIQAMYPAGSAPKADAWTIDAYMKAAEANMAARVVQACQDLGSVGQMLR